MPMINRRIIKMAIAGMAVLAVSLASATLATTAGAASGPKLKVAPAKNLTNGQSVTVSGKGFAQGQVFIIECVIGETSTSGSGCNISGLVGPETINSKGDLPATPFTVVTGSIGTQGGICGTTKSNIKDCDVSVGNASGGNAASFKITFKKPSSSGARSTHGR